MFERLHRVALAGMNMGRSADNPAWSGERVVIERLAQTPVIFDVGANIGDYASMVLEVRPGARIWCFEPSAEACSRLVNRLGHRLTAMAIALGDAEGQSDFFAPSEGSPLGSTYARQHSSLEWKPTERVHVRRLDDVCRDNSINRIDLLKIDVEGHELAVLRGAERMIRTGAIAAIQFEFGGANVDSRTFLKDFFILLSESYQIHRIVRDGLTPVAYEERTEVFTTTNYLAVRRAEGNPER